MQLHAGADIKGPNNISCSMLLTGPCNSWPQVAPQFSWQQQEPEGYCSNDGGTNRHQYCSTESVPTVETCKSYCEAYSSKCVGLTWGYDGHCRVHVTDREGLVQPTAQSWWSPQNGAGGISGVVASSGKRCYIVLEATTVTTTAMTPVHACMHSCASSVLFWS